MKAVHYITIFPSNLSTEQIWLQLSRGRLAASRPLLSEVAGEFRWLFNRLFSPLMLGENPLCDGLIGAGTNSALGITVVPQSLFPFDHIAELELHVAWQQALDITRQLLEVGRDRLLGQSAVLTLLF